MRQNSIYNNIVIKLSCMIISLVISTPTLMAQDVHVFKQEQYPTGFDNWMTVIYYYNGEKVYNIKGFVACDSHGDINALKISPSGASYTILKDTAYGSCVYLYKLFVANTLISKLKNVDNAISIAYSPDARTLAVGTQTSIHICDAQSGRIMESIPIPIKPKNIAISPNNYYLAITDGVNLIIWNIDTKKSHKAITSKTIINDISFSTDSKHLAVLTSETHHNSALSGPAAIQHAELITGNEFSSTLSIYNTQNFQIDKSYDALGDAVKCTFNNDSKYVAVVCSDKRIAIINLLDDNERFYVDNPDGGTSDVGFCEDYDNNIHLIYNSINHINIKKMGELTPNYTKLLTTELNMMMNEWVKQMPGESIDDYHLRVNENTREQQMVLFELDIATRMADDMGLNKMSKISLGSYSEESKMLSLNIGDMPTIYLEVPKNEIENFMDTDNLEMLNAKYGLTKDDKFELIYVDVRNKITGKTFTYNNIERHSLDYLNLDKNFIPLDIIQQSNMQEIKLQEIKDDIVNMAKEQNRISDHTNISVKTYVESSTNSLGEKILNYAVDFSYSVEHKFSTIEDFKPGKYKSEDSGAAKSMMEIIKQALESEFAQYVHSGKKLKIKVTGMADALPINGKISYDGCYGEYVGETIHKGATLNNITLTKSSGITTNEQLAFARALGVKEFISQNIKGLDVMDISYDYEIEIMPNTGGKYRRINVKLIFVDAF